MDMEMIMNGFRVAAFGLCGVFVVLILFYVMIKSLVAIFSRYAREKETK